MLLYSNYYSLQDIINLTDATKHLEIKLPYTRIKITFAQFRTLISTIIILVYGYWNSNRKG